MLAYQGQPYETVIHLASSTVLPGDVTLQTRKYGQTAFVTQVLTSESWIHMTEGFYLLRLPADLVDTVGNLFYQVTYSGGGFADEVTVSPPPLPSMRPGRCVLTGTITDLTGEPVTLGARITFRLVDAPYAIDGVFVQGGHYETRADAYGNFSVSLVQGVKVVVEIEQLGIKHVITVPDQETARLVDLLPPLP
jgi:hypothetical protein